MVKFSSIQRSITYSAIQVFSKLPLNITQFQHDRMQFKTALKKYLVTNVLTLIFSILVTLVYPSCF